MDIEQELWARDQQNTVLEERAAHALKRQREEIERLRAALREIAADDIYLRNSASWHDTGKMQTGVQAFARAALENKQEG